MVKLPVNIPHKQALTDWSMHISTPLKLQATSLNSDRNMVKITRNIDSCIFNLEGFHIVL